MRNVKHFFKRINRYEKYKNKSDLIFIKKTVKPIIAFILIIIVLYLSNNYGIEWVLNRIALLGVIGGLVWWGDIKPIKKS